MQQNNQQNTLRMKEEQNALIMKAKNNLIKEAKGIKSRAIERISKSFTEQEVEKSNLSFIDFVKFMNEDEQGMKQYINCYTNAYKFMHKNQVDTAAYCVDQREAGKLNLDLINAGKHVGTNNIQECVVVIIDGINTKSEEREVILAHVDINTKEESLKKVLTEFNTDSLQIKLYGGRSDETDLCIDNIEMIEKVIDECKMTNNITKKLLYEDATEPEIVYIPNKENIGGEIAEGIYPNIHCNADRLAVLVFNDTDLGNNSKEINRNSTLLITNLSVSNIHTNPFSEKKRKEIIDCYTKYYNQKLEALNDLEKWNITENKMIEYCYNHFEPFCTCAFLAMQEENITVSEQDVYNGQAVEICQKYFNATQDKLKSAKEERVTKNKDVINSVEASVNQQKWQQMIKKSSKSVGITRNY